MKGVGGLCVALRQYDRTRENVLSGPQPALLPDGTRALPAARFRCWGLSLDPHYVGADKLWWYDGDSDHVAGWYCGLCWPPLENDDERWSLQEEIVRVDGLSRLF